MPTVFVPGAHCVSDWRCCTGGLVVVSLWLDKASIVYSVVRVWSISTTTVIIIRPDQLLVSPSWSSRSAGFSRCCHNLTFSKFAVVSNGQWSGSCSTESLNHCYIFQLNTNLIPLLKLPACSLITSEASC